MDIKNYSKKISDFIDNLSDEEFDAMLVRAGIENCPFEDEVVIESWVPCKSVETNSVYMQENKLYNDGKYSSSKYRSISLPLVA